MMLEHTCAPFIWMFERKGKTIVNSSYGDFWLRNFTPVLVLQFVHTIQIFSHCNEYTQHSFLQYYDSVGQVIRKASNL